MKMQTNGQRCNPVHYLSIPPCLSEQLRDHGLLCIRTQLIIINANQIVSEINYLFIVELSCYLCKLGQSLDKSNDNKVILLLYTSITGKKYVSTIFFLFVNAP